MNPHFLFILLLFFFFFFFLNHGLAAGEPLTGLDLDKQILLSIKSTLMAQANPSLISSSLQTWADQPGNNNTCISTNNTSISTNNTSISTNNTSISTNNTNNTNNTCISTSPCDPAGPWIGITCSLWEGQPRVQKISLPGFDFSGPVPLLFFNLSALDYLNLSSNRFDGRLDYPLSAPPAQTALRTLDLSHNNLSSAGLVANLSSLEHLDLSSNFLNGLLDSLIPLNCSLLKFLNLSSNHLNQLLAWPNRRCPGLVTLDLSYNQLTGLLPSDLAIPSFMEDFVISSNQFSGFIPASLFSGPSLRRIDLSANMLTGLIPGEVGNCTTLEELFLAENRLNGSVPSDIGRLNRLRTLLLGTNGFSGSVPQAITSCSNLTMLDLSSNLLQGSIPSFLGNMSSIKYLVLHSNGFDGAIPKELTNLSHIEFLDISSNYLAGGIPFDILSGLPSLKFLLLANNGFTGGIPPQLGNLSALQFLDVSSNKLTGLIPPSLGKLQNLLWLMLAHNQLSGAIPPELGNCRSLLWLNARSNRLSGQIPVTLSEMGSDPTGTFEGNLLNFDPPRAEGLCPLLRRWIPENMPPFSFQFSVLNRNRCTQLWKNLVTGATALYSCGGLRASSNDRFIQLSDNQLTGGLSGLYQGNGTSVLLVGMNNLSGPLPGENLSNLPLFALNISQNQFQGGIPLSLPQCLNLLDISFNNFSGPIPLSLASNLTNLVYFNASYNPYLSGPIPLLNQFLTFGPSSYYNNNLLCIDWYITNITVPICTSAIAAPSVPGIEPSETSSSSSLSTNAWLIAVASSLSVLMLIITVLVGFHFIYSKHMMRRRSRTSRSLGETHHLDGDQDSTKDGSASTSNCFTRNYDSSSSCGGGEEKYKVITTSTRVCMFRSARLTNLPVVYMTYADLLVGTKNFDKGNIVGSGGFGVVYKAQLDDGSIVAVKKLMNVGCGSEAEREFLAEMSTLGNHVHPNLVPLLGCCIFGSERLLVFKYITRGSLEDCLHNDENQRKLLDWPKRLRIACGAARGLYYLHHDCSPVVIHRDLKCSNILLEQDFTALLTDFGLARELDPVCTHVSTTIAGTLGYLAPEYCQVWRSTTKGDVYSFGVVLLELVTGKRPILPTNLEHEEVGHLVEWVKMLIKEQREMEVYDPVTRGQDHNQLSEFLKLALQCTHNNPEHRPNTTDMLATLEMLDRLQCENFTI